jgi:CRP/FNR family transcriptional regulator
LRKSFPGKTSRTNLHNSGSAVASGVLAGSRQKKFHPAAKPGLNARLIRREKPMSVTQLSNTAASDRCKTCKIRRLGFCSWFDGEEAKGIVTRTSQTRFEAGSNISIQGAPASRVGIIMSGLVKIVLNDEDGGEHVIQLLHAGEMVGDPFAEESSFSWQAATDVELCWVPASVLTSSIRSSPAALQCHLDAIMRQVQEQRFAQVALRGRNSMQRVAHWLFLQVPKDATEASVRLRILLTRRDLASLLEMTIETLCRSLHQLEHRGAIRLAKPDLIEVRDRRRLGLVSRASEDRLQETLLQEGWEWGARPVGGVARPTMIQRPISGPRNRTEAWDLTPINADRRAL